MLDLVIYPDDRLRVKCKPVERIDAQFREWVHDMMFIMESNNGFGLASPQVGLDLEFFVWKFFPSVVIAPIITKRTGRAENHSEGCLSLPNQMYVVPRSDRIEVSCYDIKGKEHNMKLSGDQSIVWQHEMDHLNSRLICDY